MERRYAVGYAAGAKEQLDFLLVQQHVRGGERAVEALIEKLDGAFETLSVFPYYGAVSNQERLAYLGYRKLVFYPFVLLYSVSERRREVHRSEGSSIIVRIMRRSCENIYRTGAAAWVCG